MPHDFLKDHLYTILSGISGGIINLYLTGKSEKTTMYRIIMVLVFGLTGAVFIAPLIIEYFDISGRLMYSITFLTSVLTEIILLTFVKVFTAIMRNPFAILQMWMGVNTKEALKELKDDKKDSK